MRSRGLFLVMVVASACAGNELEPIGSWTGPICDGSEGLRFSYRQIADAPTDATRLHVEAGQRFFYVDGRCRFWVAHPDRGQPAAEVRSRVLDPEEELQLAAATQFGRWSELAGPPAGCRHPVLEPEDVFRFSDGDHEVQCGLPCGVADPGTLGEACAAMRGIAVDLYEAGAALEGPVKAQFVAPLSSSLVLEWPLGRPLAELVEATRASAIRIDDPQEARLLRLARTETLTSTWHASAVTFRVAPDGVATMLMRDVLPFESPDGTVDF